MTEEELLPFCECGKCGLRVTKKGNRFIHGHNRRGVSLPPRTPEHCTNLSKSLKNSDAMKVAAEAMRGVPKSPEHCAAVSEGIRNSDAVKAYHDSQKGVPHTPERCAAITKGLQESEAMKASAEARRGIPLSPEYIAAVIKGQEEAGVYEAMRGGNDLVNHHYIYDHANPKLYTMKVTRAKHAQIHAWMRKAGIKVPHINEEIGKWRYA